MPSTFSVWSFPVVVFSHSLTARRFYPSSSALGMFTATISRRELCSLAPFA